MRGIDVHLYVAGVIPAERALSPSPPPLISLSPTSTAKSATTDNDHVNNSSSTNRNHHTFGLHHLVDLAHDAIKTIMINSGPTGRFEDLLMLDPTQVLQHVGRKMLRLKASFENGIDTPHDGFVDLIEPNGISVISDIDDTIKVTGILDGKDTILQNTFFRKADEVPGMSEVYRNWSKQGAHVHYVSNSPWQVYPALSEFVRDRHFPAGSMHLRAISTGDLIRRKPGQHKLDVIHQILQDFPNRKFILVGDSGERDPEIYQQIYKQYPEQIIKIFIHDVTSERARHADQRESERSDSYYNNLKKFLARDQQSGGGGNLPRRSATTTTSMLDAIGETEIPDEEKVMMDPTVSLKTKLDIFHERMDNLARELPEGVLTVFTLASQLRTDPIITHTFGTRARKSSLSSSSHMPSPIPARNSSFPV
ncbi:hypothetical protein BDB00DRAFT_850493 [Zychaea mexicana]|uniref:uncharacterized protein n=1 Tax=Zychaea mexicana TaxID=64656 RepID=UPI0022FDF875|nr:uncharacterized protein BDB00DRAFT_850493 [Zychaea mexicana]KAI9487981.1 hypothetical protein BDB00DRAFT_850493 [Zychaea mexicana]